MAQLEPIPYDRPTGLSPLWIFSIFVALCEATAGVTAMIVSGWVQAMLGIFTISFPVLVLVVFLFVLWKRPIILYGPSDFPPNVDVEVFAQVMRHNLTETIALAGTTAASSVTAVAEELALPENEARKLAAKAKSAAEDGVRSRVAKVDLSDFLGPGKVLDFVVTEVSTVSDFLGSIYTAICQFVPRYTYGVSWLVKAQDDGRLFKEMGTSWALNTGYGKADTRKLVDVGVAGGMSLAVVKL